MSTNGVVSECFPSLDNAPQDVWLEIKLGCIKFPWLTDIFCDNFQLQVGNVIPEGATYK